MVDDGSKDSTSAFVFNHYVKKYGTDRWVLKSCMCGFGTKTSAVAALAGNSK